MQNIAIVHATNILYYLRMTYRLVLFEGVLIGFMNIYKCIQIGQHQAIYLEWVGLAS